MNFVTGATGHIGNVLVRELVARGERVRALLFPGEDRKPLEGLGVEIVEGDVLDKNVLRRAMRGVSRVFHLAGAPEGFRSVEFKSPTVKDARYTVQVSPEDCTGCNLCVELCPESKAEKRKALALVPMAPLRARESRNFAFFQGLPEPDRKLLDRALQEYAALSSGGVAAGRGAGPRQLFLKVVKVAPPAGADVAIVRPAFVGFKHPQGVQQVTLRERHQPGGKRTFATGLKSVHVQKGVDVGFLHQVFGGQDGPPSGWDFRSKFAADFRTHVLEQICQGLSVTRNRLFDEGAFVSRHARSHSE